MLTRFSRRKQFFLSVCILCSVCSPHFVPSLHFVPGLQSAFCTDRIEHASSQANTLVQNWQTNTLVLFEICRYNPIPWSAAAYNSIYKYIGQLNALLKTK